MTYYDKGASYQDSLLIIENLITEPHYPEIVELLHSTLQCAYRKLTENPTVGENGSIKNG